MELQRSYLESIQAIPGDTPGEKLKTIATWASDIVQAGGNVEIGETAKIPQLLLPLVRVEVAKFLKQHDVITESLKSSDAYVIDRALQAAWYFDGSTKTIGSADYFRRHLLPHVSLKTRSKIVKTFAARLCPKEQRLAEELFDVVMDMYGVEQALPLLVACSESFIHDAIVKHKIVLPRRIVKILYRRNPNTVIAYLKLSTRKIGPHERRSHEIPMHQYDDYLSKLVKNHCDAFVEIYEGSSARVTLSKKCAEAFLKNGRDHFLRNPAVYAKLLPLKLISADLIEAVLPKLMPEKVRDFQAKDILDYLAYYPKEKRVPLLKRVFKDVYGEELLTDSSRVTPKLLAILPAEERIQQARIKIGKEESPRIQYDYETVWRCYLPTGESIPQIKKDIAETSDMDGRYCYLRQMVYTCKVNQDDAALLDFLKYFQNRHRNEQTRVQFGVLRTLLGEYDIVNLSEAHWAVLDEIIQRFNVKGEFQQLEPVLDDLLEASIHYRLLHGLSIDNLVDIFLDKQIHVYTTVWNMIVKNHEFEWKVLELCLEKVSKKYESNDELWLEKKVQVITVLIQSIYDFNDRHTKPPSRVERMSIKSYPWLLEMTRTIVLEREQKCYRLNSVLKLLEKHEKEYYELWVVDKERLPDVQSGGALRLLKRDPKKILDNWTEYLKMCKNVQSVKVVIHFLRAVRWYKDIPIKFSRQCMEDFAQQKNGQDLLILSALVDGHILQGLIEPLLPTASKIDFTSDNAESSYELTVYQPICMRVVNPPLPLSLVGRFCSGDYLSHGLACLANVCRRTPVPEVLEFAKSLLDRPVSVRKHGIRIVCLFGTLEEVSQFLRTQWRIETNKSIREVLFAKITELFKKHPGPLGWSLINDVISSFTIVDESALSDLILAINVVSDDYVEAFVELLLSTVEKLAKAGLRRPQVVHYTNRILGSIDAATCNLLSEELCRDILKRFFLDPASEDPSAIIRFVLFSYLCPEDAKVETRVATVCEFLRESVRAHWDEPHAKKPRHFPVNYAVSTFVRTLVTVEIPRSTRARVVDILQNTLPSVLTSYQDIDSHMRLFLAQHYLTVASLSEFGAIVAEKLPPIVQVYTPLVLPIVDGILRSFVDGWQRTGDRDLEKSRLDLVEGLVRVGGLYPWAVAATFLNRLENVAHAQRYDRLVDALRGCDEPIVRSIVSNKLSEVSYQECVSNDSR